MKMPLLEGAVLAQSFAMVKTLLDLGAHPTSKDGISKPLLRAIKTGQADSATLLLESGADINSKYNLDALYRDIALTHLDSNKWPIMLPILVKSGSTSTSSWHHVDEHFSCLSSWMDPGDHKKTGLSS